MSLKFGLNLKKSAPPAKKKTILDDELGDDDGDGGELHDAPPVTGPRKRVALKASENSNAPPSRVKKIENDNRQNASSMRAARQQVKAAEELDPSIFDYDTFLDAKSTVTEAKKAIARQDAIDRKPKYIDKLLDAASRRKQDQLVAQEKLLQREREAEGGEFADKEKFVTGAYKEQQAETARLQAEERARAEADEERQRRMGRGMKSFYKNMMEQSERSHQEAVDAAANYDKTAAVGEQAVDEDVSALNEARAKGVDVRVNDEGQVIDKRDLLTAGLNVAPSGRGGAAGGADHLKASASKTSAFQQRDFASDRAQGERRRQMIEEQLEASAKRKREASEEQRAQEERDAKSKKTEKDVSDAKARYLARKAAKERGEG